MDNHPIPQDVTNFQFRLIGDMTLKQFGYIFGGVILAWVFLASPIFLLLKTLFAGFSVLSAVILAFIPIEGRSADIIVMHFLKALLSPTQFFYQKGQIPTQPQANKTFTSPKPKQEEDEKKNKKPEIVRVDGLNSAATAAVLQQEEKSLTPTPQPQKEKQEELISEKELQLQKEALQLSRDLANAKKQETNITSNNTIQNIPHEKVTELEKQLQEIMNQKQMLENQLVELQKIVSEKKQQVFSPTTASVPQTQNVKKVPKQISVGVGAPLVPDVPNLITGVIKDPRANVLANILIEVKDKDGNPVRAFKTNQLGQFAAATPLINGTYTISFEDPSGNQTFDSVEIITTGEILPPLEIISVDAREKLRQELFGNSNNSTTMPLSS